ncbi:SRPBCC domain-containing protein [uncultured Tateyamaria sp.]|uniref:SRPBCC family protein n=1 Tax=uncultured Tateyamaria sp. TaxID=455651 RepID=UPI0026250043|nr:SRPBCC domain-containing protein [uncultured Tateyamaria sp.]
MTDPDIDVVEVSETIPANVKDVWEAWTVPDIKKTWWGKTENLKLVLCEMDVRVGGTYRYGMAKSGETSVEEAANGKYLAVEPYKKLVYTWNWGGDSPSVKDTLVTVTFESISDNLTRVNVVHERQPTETVSAIHADGWTNKLADLVLFARLSCAAS